MTPDEYIQLKAFARVDGLWLALLWTLNFACYLLGFENPLIGWMAIILIIWNPFFIAKRLRKFRDNVLEGIISFGRGWGYVALMFFYAGILFAIVLYVYFAFLDQGYIVSMLQKAMETPEMVKQIAQYEGMDVMISDALMAYSQIRPIDIAINFVTMTLMIGIFLGLPIAASVKRNIK